MAAYCPDHLPTLFPHGFCSEETTKIFLWKFLKAQSTSVVKVSIAREELCWHLPFLNHKSPHSFISVFDRRWS